MSLLLSARGLNKRFGAVIAADDVSIDVPPGQKLSLIGSNGAGKTTFINMVTGFLKPDSGQIDLLGDDITRLSPRHIARLGICRSFQIPQLCLELTTLENLLVAVAASSPKRLSLWNPAEANGGRERAEHLLERFGLAPSANRRVTELAGGVRKLLDIAMALARHPKLLLLDEPTSGVSAEEKVPTMERAMDALAQESVTVMFVEHDMDIVAAFAERVIAFYSGRIIDDGVPAAVLNNPEVQRYVTGATK